MKLDRYGGGKDLEGAGGEKKQWLIYKKQLKKQKKE